MFAAALAVIHPLLTWILTTVGLAASVAPIVLTGAMFMGWGPRVASGTQQAFVIIGSITVN